MQPALHQARIILIKALMKIRQPVLHQKNTKLKFQSKNLLIIEMRY